MRLGIINGSFASGDTPAEGADAPPPVAAVLGTGTTAEVWEARYNVFPWTVAEFTLGGLGYVDAAQRAVAAGCDGVVFNTVGDYLLADARSLIEKPVVGAGEAAIALASTLGRTFSIVTIWPASMHFLYEKLLRETESQARCVSVRHVSTDEDIARTGALDPALRMAAGDADILQAIIRQCELSISEDKADVIILGCTCMLPLWGQIKAALPVPVIEGLTTGVKQLETQLSLGLSHSPAAFAPVAPERRTLISDLLNAAPPPVQDAACVPCAAVPKQAA